jgi:hypothetical protein
MWSYAKGILIGLDVLANALIGGRHYQTISCRIGESIADNGWAPTAPKFVPARLARAFSLEHPLCRPLAFAA